MGRVSLADDEVLFVTPAMTAASEAGRAAIYWS